jgi:hypothetical protein
LEKKRLNTMKSLLPSLLIISLIIASCDNGENPSINEFTGNEIVYSLEQGSQYEISGTVKMREKKDGSAMIEIALSGTAGEQYHPVHLHMGDVTLPDAEIAALLNPIYGKTGISSTNLKMLADESAITYNGLKNLAGSIKIHLAASGAERDIILAAGNIGQLSTGLSSGRLSIGTCKSEQ